MTIEEEEEEFSSNSDDAENLYSDRDYALALIKRISVVPTESVGVQLTSKSSSLGHHFNLVISLLVCRKICQDISAYVLWNEIRSSEEYPQESLRFSPQAIEGFRNFDYWFEHEVPDLLEYEFFNVDITQIQQALKILSDYDVSRHSPLECQFNFDVSGLYKVNPTNFRIMAVGGATALVVLTLAFGAVQITKEANAGDCRALYSEIIKGERETLERLGRRQGRVTDSQQASHDRSIKAILAASAACGSLLSNVTLKVSPFPNAGFTITMNGNDIRGSA